MRGLHAPKRTIVVSSAEIDVYEKIYGDASVIDLDIRQNGNTCVVKHLTRSSGIELAGTRHALRGWQFTVVSDWVE